MKTSELWRKSVMLITLGLGVGFSSASYSAEGYVTANVVDVLLNADDSWGGCMAKLSANPRNELPSCSDDWVTFSCSGEFTDNVRAYRMFDQAQLALVTGKTVILKITDAQKHDGFCFVRSFELLQ